LDIGSLARAHEPVRDNQHSKRFSSASREINLASREDAKVMSIFLPGTVLIGWERAIPFYLPFAGSYPANGDVMSTQQKALRNQVGVRLGDATYDKLCELAYAARKSPAEFIRDVVERELGKR
jgi:hypothetical protein